MRDNCPLVANGDQTDADRNGIGDGCEGTNRVKTIEALRNVDGQPRFDEIFRFLAGNKTVMPGWDVEAKGWVRIAPNAGDVDRLVLQRAMMNIWQGKHWYTNADGGTIYNRMFDDRQAWIPPRLLDDVDPRRQARHRCRCRARTRGSTTSASSSPASTSGSR